MIAVVMAALPAAHPLGDPYIRGIGARITAVPLHHRVRHAHHQHDAPALLEAGA
ncbi:hypothetical protein [Spongiactinospora sp. 9N601]|uniref:hypothetical protein n=1 Tax=Spongiactinospora sp. 9N601 TaxID=3375149 RepID=UPI0037A11443